MDTDNQPATDEDRTDNLITLPTKTLEQILDQIDAPDVIDYLSIDVEGAEDRILGRFPFDRYTFTTITIERPSASLQNILKVNGYILMKHMPGVDNFYMHKSYLGDWFFKVVKVSERIEHNYLKHYGG